MATNPPNGASGAADAPMSFNDVVAVITSEIMVRQHAVRRAKAEQEAFLTRRPAELAVEYAYGALSEVRNRARLTQQGLGQDDACESESAEDGESRYSSEEVLAKAYERLVGEVAPGLELQCAAPPAPRARISATQTANSPGVAREKSHKIDI